VLTLLGDTHEAAGRSGTARELWRQALEIFDEMRHPLAEQLKGKLAAS
jgi:hypothetical protein